MFDNAKYIMYEHEMVGPTPVIFPNHIKHNEMDSFLMRGGFPGFALSAGFVTKDLKCYGRSESMGLPSKEIDTRIVRRDFEVRDV